MLQNLTRRGAVAPVLVGLLACGEDVPGTVEQAPAPSAAASNGMPGAVRGLAGDTAGDIAGNTVDENAAARGGARRIDDTRRAAPASWCARAGAAEGDWVNAAAAVATAYIEATTEDCATSQLTAALSADVQTDWKNYLISYTLGLAECPLLFGPLDGGTGAFGPANMRAIGVEQPRLGSDDASALIGYYSSEFGVAFELRPDEVEAVVSHLGQAALDRIDPAAARVLSACGASADAGD